MQHSHPPYSTLSKVVSGFPPLLCPLQSGGWRCCLCSAPFRMLNGAPRHPLGLRGGARGGAHSAALRVYSTVPL